MSMMPKARPKANRETVEAVSRAAFTPGPLPALYVLAVRGYYLRTMGDPRSNDRGIYDDAMFVVTPYSFVSFNANTDPSIRRKGIATLVPGVYWYRPGKHGISRPGGGYPAFRPATVGEVLPVTRDGLPGIHDGVAINIHPGGYTTTSSEGCQTVPPSQWDEFHSTVTRGLTKTGQSKIPYILIDGPLP